MYREPVWILDNLVSLTPASGRSVTGFQHNGKSKTPAYASEAKGVSGMTVLEFVDGRESVWILDNLVSLTPASGRSVTGFQHNGGEMVTVSSMTAVGLSTVESA